MIWFKRNIITVIGANTFIRHIFKWHSKFKGYLDTRADDRNEERRRDKEKKIKTVHIWDFTGVLSPYLLTVLLHCYLLTEMTFENLPLLRKWIPLMPVLTIAFFVITYLIYERRIHVFKLSMRCKITVTIRRKKLWLNQSAISAILGWKNLLTWGIDF